MMKNVRGEEKDLEIALEALRRVFGVPKRGRSVLNSERAPCSRSSLLLVAMSEMALAASMSFDATIFAGKLVVLEKLIAREKM